MQYLSKHVCFWHTGRKSSNPLSTFSIVFFIVMNIMFRQFASHSAFLKVSENSTWELEKKRERKKLTERERGKPLRNVMFVFNPFFSHCSHCLISIVGDGGEDAAFPLPTLDWVAASREAFHSLFLAHSSSFLWPPPSLFHTAFLLCAVCFYFQLVSLFFFLFCFSSMCMEAKWSETSHQLATPPSQSLFESLAAAAAA